MSNYVKYDSNMPLFYHQTTTDTCDVEIHIHDYYEIFQAQSDNIRYFVEGHAYDLKKNDLIVTTSKEIHRPTVTDQSPYGRRFIQFDPLLVPSYSDLSYQPLQMIENRPLGQHNHLSLPLHALSVIDQYFEGIHSALYNNGPRSLYEARLILTQLLMEIGSLFTSQKAVSRGGATMDPRIYTIRRYLDQHYQEKFNLEALSQTHLMDKYYLSHLFKEETGFTLLEYVQSKRIMMAKTLLKSPANIGQISRQCGYDDYTNFYKTFKKLIKMSPKDYRKLVQS